MTELERLKKSYPTAFYENGAIWLKGQDDKPFVNEEDTKALIEEHWDGSELILPHPSGDPTKEEFITVYGFQYIFEKFGGNYKVAFDNV